MSNVFTRPESVTRETLPEAIALANRVFRTHSGDMAQQLPTVFDPAAPDRLRVIRRDGKAVSMVGTVVSDVSVLGCSMRIACMGAVCTDESARHQGLAGRLVEDSFARATAAGACLMFISGSRPIYTERGASFCGLFHKCRLQAASMPDDPGLEPVRVTQANCAAAARLAEAEAIRFRRAPEVYSRLIACGYAGNRPSKTYLVRRMGRDLGALTVAMPGDGGELTVAELAGSRPAVLAGLRQACRGENLTAASLQVYPTDVELLDLCRGMGGEITPKTSRGSVKLLDAQRLWQAFAPLVADRIGAEAHASLSIEPTVKDDKVVAITFAFGNESFTVQGKDEVMYAFFGSPNGSAIDRAPGRLGEMLRSALPLAMPMYGLNYV